MRLSDGTLLHKGQEYGEMHFWNEHLPQIPRSGPAMAWAIPIARRVRSSLRRWRIRRNRTRG